MVKSLDEVIERLQYKADNIKAKLEPSYFTECIDYLKTLPREENIGEDYAEKLVNTVAKAIVEAFENLTIEDVNMYKVGYNKAIDEFAERIIELDAEFPTVEDDFGEYRPMTIKEMCSVIAEQMKGET